MASNPVKMLFHAGLFLRVIFVWLAVGVVTVWWCGLIIICSPVVHLFDKKARFLHTLSVLWGRSVVLVLPNLRYTVKGKENIMPNGNGVIYVANHQSQLDILALFILGPHFRWLAKQSLFMIPIFGWALKLSGNVSVIRNDRKSRAKCMEDARKIIERGISMVFFPEGTRSLDGVLKSFKLGAFSLAKDTGVPIVPVTIVGADAFLPKGSIVPKGNRFDIIVHPRIEVAERTVLQLSNLAREAIASALPPEKRGAVVMSVGKDE